MISEKCKTTYAKLNTFVTNVINRDVTPKIDSLRDGKEDNANKVTSLSSSSTDTQYPSAKAVFDSLPSVPNASSVTPSADTTNGSVGDGTTWARSNHTHPKSSLYAEASHTHSEYVNPTIVDNLTTNDATKVLSAKQGKVLNDMIGDAISYINQ